jgi:hypothetical protein
MTDLQRLYDFTGTASLRQVKIKNSQKRWVLRIPGITVGIPAYDRDDALFRARAYCPFARFPKIPGT